MKRVLIPLIGLLLITSQTFAQSIIVKLASVDAGVLVSETSSEAVRLKRAWGRVSGLCAAPNGLENQVSHVRNELLAKKAATSNVELLEGLAGVLYGAASKPECSKLLGTYAALRLGDQPEMSTHTDVVLGMRGLARKGLLGFTVRENSEIK